MLQHMDVPMTAWRNENEWIAFSKEFEENFKTKFGDFYEQHGEDIRQMMEDVQSKLNTRFDNDWEMKVQDLVQKQSEWAMLQANEWEKSAQDFSERNDEQRKKSEADMKRWEERQQFHQQEFEKNQVEFEKSMKAFDANNKQFEEELKTELRKDGYLGADEKLVNMHWHNGEIEINGKKIKPSDEKKYNELHAKFFRGMPHPPKP
jgi:creatinine amidohydrolase/Fe(II)-dependent formamide hydrolase-like protein